jgi:hypothetical protein
MNNGQRGYSQREAKRRHQKTIWVGRTLGRDVICHKCNSRISRGEQGFTKANQVDLTEWHCEPCVT